MTQINDFSTLAYAAGASWPPFALTAALVGWRRSATHLRASLLDPNDDIDAAYRQVTVQPRGGEAVRGILRNEDSFSIQLIDSREELRSFAKTDLTGIDRSGGSLMPALTGRFGDDEVTNLVAYLASLRPE